MFYGNETLLGHVWNRDTAKIIVRLFFLDFGIIAIFNMFKNTPNLSDPNSYATWSRGMSRMSKTLILSYRVKDLMNCYVLHCFELNRIVHIFASRYLIVWGLDQHVAFQMDKRFILKNENWILPTCDSLPLIVSHICNDFWKYVAFRYS